MNAICEGSLYNICSCKKKYHLPLGLSLYDGHCHVDLFFKYGFNEVDFNSQLAYGRKIVLIDNRHHYQRWFINYMIDNPNAKIFTTYGIHPKYIPINHERALQELKNIFENKINLNTSKVAIGECGIDDTSRSSFDSQLFTFRSQLQIAATLNIQVVLHGRGENSFQIILNELKKFLNHNHNIQWHCINTNSDLNIISDFLNYFNNSFIGLNGSVIAQDDPESQKQFNSWLINQTNIIDRIILETDFPFLRPPGLDPYRYTPVSGITFTAQYIVNVLRMKNMNTTKLIDKSNSNIQRMYVIN
ncbi:unnamed protein product [Adineta ricciae]|uniref:Uncharacterized protein n=1 Tax=Adineta ricciae TaxID=249248 RepID=A0A816GNN8_ADIRI|nr:unnamed protein product [Adineta ricciae]